MKMSETATKELVNTLNDPEEPFTAEVEEAAVGVAGCLKNVLKSASGASQAIGSISGDSSSSKVQKNLFTTFLLERFTTQIHPQRQKIIQSRRTAN